ncbi:hypothetical protein BCD48_36135 [Pseudofrankia sp. BMG5.36]|nr:hypothetical protein BCD48_36135 [Pseudofrankia sp. BMG5.36]
MAGTARPVTAVAGTTCAVTAAVRPLGAVRSCSPPVCLARPVGPGRPAGALGPMIVRPVRPASARGPIGAPAPGGTLGTLPVSAPPATGLTGLTRPAGTAATGGAVAAGVPLSASATAGRTVVPPIAPLAAPFVALPPWTARPRRTVAAVAVTRRARTVAPIGRTSCLAEATRALPRSVRIRGPVALRPAAGTLGTAVTAGTARRAPAGLAGARRPATGRVMPSPAVPLPATGGRPGATGPLAPAGATPSAGRTIAGRAVTSAEPFSAAGVGSATGVVAAAEAVSTTRAGPVGTAGARVRPAVAPLVAVAAIGTFTRCRGPVRPGTTGTTAGTLTAAPSGRRAAGAAARRPAGASVTAEAIPTPVVARPSGLGRSPARPSGRLTMSGSLVAPVSPGPVRATGRRGPMWPLGARARCPPRLAAGRAPPARAATGRAGPATGAAVPATGAASAARGGGGPSGSRRTCWLPTCGRRRDCRARHRHRFRSAHAIVGSTVDFWLRSSSFVTAPRWGTSPTHPTRRRAVAHRSRRGCPHGPLRQPRWAGGGRWLAADRRDRHGPRRMGLGESVESL